ncbi:hypothetical protein ACS0TY_010098 [Phlomoides rotata]
MNVDSASNRVGDETQDESESTDTGKMNSGRKRKSPLQPDPMVCVVQNFCDNASNRLGDIAQRIGHGQDMSAARKMIYSSISKMSILTLHEKLRATALIAHNAEDIDVFFSLPDPDRVEWEIRFCGVRKRPWGRYAAEIKDPWKKTHVWLGTFDLVEDAARAYDTDARSLRGPKIDLLPELSSGVFI